MKVFKVTKWLTFFICLFSISAQSQWMKKTFPYAENLNMVRFASPQIGWILGENHLFKTTDGGSTWSINDTSIGTWKGLQVLDDTTVVRFDSKWGIIRTSNGGKTWIIVDSTIDDINSFDFVNSKLGFAAGGHRDTAVVYRTMDGGKAWERISHTYIKSFSSDFSKVSFIDSLQGWAVTYSGMIYHSTDGGFNWVFQDSTAMANYLLPLRDIQFTSPENGLAVGGISGFSIILRTTDGGNTWIPSSIPVGITNCSFKEIYMLDSNTGWLVGSYNGGPAYIIKTTDGGINWTDETPKDIQMGFESISMLNESHGFIVGGMADFYETNNGGLTGIENENINKVDKFSLSQNYPNPFNPSTNISFTIPEKSFVTIKLYNILGKETAIIFRGEKNAGNYNVKFSADNLPSGIYFYQLTAGSYTATKKMTLLK